MNRQSMYQNNLKQLDRAADEEDNEVINSMPLSPMDLLGVKP